MVEVAGHNRRLSAEGRTPPPAPFSAPRTSLNGTLSSRRRFATVTVPLDDAKLVRGAFGGTVNDVLLAGVAGALRRLLDLRGEVPERPLVALVPVSTRPGGATSAAGTPLGNQVSGMLVSLPTDVEDPVQRLSAVARSTAVAKEQERLTGGRLLADLAEISPPALASRAARWASGLGLFNRLPLCNVVVSGVPGPDFALWCAGSRVTALYPVGPVADGVGLNVTAMSYRGAIHVRPVGLPPPRARCGRPGRPARRRPRGAGGSGARRPRSRRLRGRSHRTASGRRSRVWPDADVAQLVEHHLAKVRVAGSSPVIRSKWA